MNRIWLLLVLLVAPVWARAQSTLTIGSLTVTQCPVGYGGYCGSFTRPLDPSGHMPGTLTIGFEWFPRRDRSTPALGTVAAQEGGPGYSTTGSRDGYVRLFAPLRDHRDLLLMDKRGTGTSGPLVCPSLQGSGSADAAQYARCGAKLGPAAWFYATRFAADDLSALLHRLNRDKVDLYGDSYGTYFGQVFARRHPDQIRTLVLDSAYPAGGPAASAWFPTEYPTTLRALNAVCRTAVHCPGDPVARLDRLVATVRAHPLSGEAPNASGSVMAVTIDPPTLFMMFDFAGNSPVTWRDADAATRAWFDHDDSLPLLRLAAEAVDGNGLGGNAVRQFSNGLATAVICADYPQLFDYTASPARRRAQYQNALAAKQRAHPDLYAPFTIAEAIAAPYQPLELGVCLDWPAPPPGAGPEPPHGEIEKLPVLVINGGLDTVTSQQEGRAVALMFDNARFVVVANAIHETAIGDGGVFVTPYGADLARCAGPIVLQFVATAGERAASECAQDARPIRPPAAFVEHAADASLPAAQPGNAATPEQLRIASAAAETVGDAIARYFQWGTPHGRGLRGGRFAFHPYEDGYRFDLDGVLWTEDLPVSGSITWNQRSGAIHAAVLFSGAASGSLSIDWNDRRTDAVATLSGSIDGRTIVATRIAP